MRAVSGCPPVRRMYKKREDTGLSQHPPNLLLFLLLPESSGILLEPHHSEALLPSAFPLGLVLHSALAVTPRVTALDRLVMIPSV